MVSPQFEGLPKPPYAIAYVRLDGVDTAMNNFVRRLDLPDVPKAMAQMKPGLRAQVRFKDQPEGRITDFHYELTR
ncbi:MAG: hypothetical protein Q8L49_04295 [Burkholderiaceae bacterium]|nr:hypothetical protein [Burkholderiaceae bacterium]